MARVKFPQILVYKEYLEMYSYPESLFYRDGSKYKPVTPGILQSNPDEPLYFKDETFGGATIYNPETDAMRNKRQMVITLLRKHGQALYDIEQAMVRYVQEYRTEYPTLYFAVLADARGSESSYLTAKTLIPTMDGKNKEIRIYLGLDKDYPDYKSNPKVQHIAEQKMKGTLREKLDNGEFEPSKQ